MHSVAGFAAAAQRQYRFGALLNFHTHPPPKLGIQWESDRGKDVASAPWFTLGPTCGEPEGTRINDHHLSLAEKQAAREKAGGTAAK